MFIKVKMLQFLLIKYFIVSACELFAGVQLAQNISVIYIHF
jgi:hypothetical protein